MNQFIDTTKFLKPLSTKVSSNRPTLNVIMTLNILAFMLFGLTNCRNQDKNASATTQVTTEQTASATTQVSTEPTASTAASTTATSASKSASSTVAVPDGKNADQLKTAQAPQSPLHKLLDSLNKAGQPQWKLTYLDSVARKNPKITMPQLKHVLDSLGKVKRGFIKK
jgi:hypothetical protein